MGIAKIACWIAYIVMGLVQLAALMCSSSDLI